VFEKLVYKSMLGTRDQTKLSVTLHAKEPPNVFNLSTLGFFSEKGILEQIRANFAN